MLTDSAAHIQADSHVLQLLDTSARALCVPVRAQAGLPRRQQPPQSAALLPQRDSLLLVTDLLSVMLVINQHLIPVYCNMQYLFLYV